MSGPRSANATKRVLLLKPRGFCAGVVRAIDVVNIALDTFGAPIYVRKEIVHNRFVVNELAEKGAIFVDDIDDVPEGMRVIYSAHGVSPAVRARSKSRKLKVIDATCPLVTKVHVEAVKFARQGYSLVLIGHRDHDEIDIGIGGRAAEAVGQKLKELSRAQQVLCVTHLPQIAAFADQHFLVEKQERQGKTKTSVRLLEDHERTEEVARMLSGAKLTDTSLRHAEQLLKTSRKTAKPKV